MLYASSGIKDDGYTRDYDMTGGTGLYLTGGAWEQIHWTKEDATGPLQLTTADGQPLVVSPGKSFIAIWGGYYGQGLTLTGADGTQQTLPEKPALLESGISDEPPRPPRRSLTPSRRSSTPRRRWSRPTPSCPTPRPRLEEAQAALDADSSNEELIAKREEARPWWTA